MLIISKNQFLEELEKEKSLTQKLVIKDESPIINEVVMENHTYDNFRKKELPNIPNEVKPIIGALALTEGREEVAKVFGVSQDTVGDLVNDKHGNAEVTEKKINILEKVRENTLSKLDNCIDFLTIAKDMKPRELVQTAESLARIHEKLTPKETEKPSTTQFIFYTPERQNKIEDYEVVEASV